MGDGEREELKEKSTRKGSGRDERGRGGQGERDRETCKHTHTHTHTHTHRRATSLERRSGGVPTRTMLAGLRSRCMTRGLLSCMYWRPEQTPIIQETTSGL